MILLIDNYDSFSYNLYQLVGSLRPDIRVVRNDALTLDAIEKLRPEAIILSPGPGRPADAGICIATVRRFGSRIPILGICLGHQAICEAYGGVVSYAPELMHGKASPIRVDPASKLFRGLGPVIIGARYHSLAAVRETLPPDLLVTAEAEDGTVMAVSHRTHPVHGLQFHPESILTPHGIDIVRNFLKETSY